MQIKVKAIKQGFDGLKRIKEGTKFQISERFLKTVKAKDAKGKEVEVVVLPSWVKALEPLPSQALMKKALIDFQNARKKIKTPEVLAPVDAEEVEETESEDEETEETVEQEVI